MSHYHGSVGGNIIPSSSSWSPFPALIFNFLLRRIRPHMLHDDAGVVLVDFQNYIVRETRNVKVQPFSIIDHPLGLKALVYEMLADIHADFVPTLWDRLAQEVVNKANDLAQQHGRTCVIVVEACLEIRTPEDVYSTSRTASALDSTRQRLMETAFKVGSDDPKYDDVGGSCSVCLEELRGEMELIKTPCDHTFHKECIIRWLENGKSCPLCRFEFD